MGDPQDHSRSRAILIGTATYDCGDFLPLPAAANSLRAFGEVLADPALCGWPESQITVMQDSRDVTGLVRQMRRLAEQTHDVLLVYFVGHGTMNDRAEVCLALSDTDLADPDITGLAYSHVRDALQRSPARVKIVILDCCYAGRAIATQALSAGLADSTAVEGAYVMTASDHAAHVPALAEQQDACTSFTRGFLAIVGRGIDDGPPELTLGLIYNALRAWLRQRGLPAPNQRNTDIAAQYPFAANVAYQPHAVPDDPLLASRLPRRGSGLVLSDRRGSSSVHALAFHPDGVILACGGFDGLVRTWDVVQHQLTSTHRAADRQITTMAYSPDGHLAIGSHDGLLKFRGRCWGFKDWVNALALSPDGTALACGAPAAKLFLWNVADAEHGERLPGHRHSVTSVAFSPDGATLASADADARIILWDPASRRASHTLHGHRKVRLTGGVNCLAFSPDSATLASGGVDKTIRLWDVATGRNRLTIEVSTGRQGIISMAFSPDGKVLASGGADRPVMLWDVTTGNEVGRFFGHGGGRVFGGVLSVAFSPDGAMLASGGYDRTVRLWNL